MFCLAVNSSIDGVQGAPDAHLRLDASTEYKVLFDFTVVDDNLDDPYPLLPLVAKYVNTLTNLGVYKENGKIAIVLYQGSELTTLLYRLHCIALSHS